jgi:hypothetical protein
MQRSRLTGIIVLTILIYAFGCDEVLSRWMIEWSLMFKAPSVGAQSLSGLAPGLSMPRYL